MYTIGKKTTAKDMAGKSPKNDADNYYFEGWSVHAVEGRFELRFSSGYHGGILIKICITESDFNSASQGKITFLDLYKKYESSRSNTRIF